MWSSAFVTEASTGTFAAVGICVETVWQSERQGRWAFYRTPQWCRVGDRMASVRSGGSDAQRAYAAARVITLATVCSGGAPCRVLPHMPDQVQWRSHSSCFDGAHQVRGIRGMTRGIHWLRC